MLMTVDIIFFFFKGHSYIFIAYTVVDNGNLLCYVEYPLFKATSFPFFWINFVKHLSMVLCELVFKFKIKP